MTATGFDIQRLPTGDVLMEFFGDDCMTFNSQVMTKDCLARLPVVATALRLVLDEGEDAALAYLFEQRQRIKH